MVVLWKHYLKILIECNMDSNIKKEIPIFNKGTYNLKCPLFKDISIGSVLCVGHPTVKIPKCKFCISYKEESSYVLPVSKKAIPIVSEVLCNRPGSQLSIF